jgi:formylmethanofuran dehydrogenase subunit E-like metal-binding protein
MATDLRSAPMVRLCYIAESSNRLSSSKAYDYWLTVTGRPAEELVRYSGYLSTLGITKVGRPLERSMTSQPQMKCTVSLIAKRIFSP